MSKSSPLLRGTFILTTAGFLTRIIGFFFRMFLSHSFGEEQVGLYQLVFPIYALCFSLTCGGVQTAISRIVANKTARGNYKQAKNATIAGAFLSFVCSCWVSILLRLFAKSISTYIVKDIRVCPLLTVISYALPLASIHSCICGYFLGQKKTKIPALSQLLEQILRVAATFIIYSFGCNIASAVIGVVVGELGSSLFCLLHFVRKKNESSSFFMRKYTTHLPELFAFILPLTGSRILINLLQSVESVSIPLKLQTFGYSPADALSIYGVLTGMALPCILFPSAITGSLSTMLLPEVAHLQSMEAESSLKKLVRKSYVLCLILGLCCCLFFTTQGLRIGRFLFDSPLAGDFIMTLAWLCPFLYANTTLGTIINGLGKPNLTFFINALSLCIRISGIFFAIPLIGINGYLYAILISQMTSFILSILCLTILSKKN